MKDLLTLFPVLVIFNEHDLSLSVSLAMHSTVKDLLTLSPVLVISKQHDVEFISVLDNA